jgi:hypothetical protein
MTDALDHRTQAPAHSRGDNEHQQGQRAEPADAMHIGRAAETLRIAQPALTIQIKACDRADGR